MDFFVLLPLASTALNILLAVLVYFKGPKKNLNRIFALFSISLAYWAFTEFGYHYAETFETAYLWVKLGALWPMSLTFLLHFAVVFTENSRFLKSKFTMPLVYIPAVFFSFIDLSTDWIAGKPIKEYGYWTYGNPGNPLIFDISSVWALLLSITAIYLCLKHYLKTTDLTKKNQTKYVIIGISAPVLLGAVTDGLVSLLEIRIPDLMPLMFTITSITIGYATWKHKLFT